MGDVNESQQKSWLDANVQQVLADIGVAAGQVVVDFGCGGGTYTIAAAHLVSDAGTVYAVDKDTQALAGIRHNASKQELRNIKTMLQVETPTIQLRGSSCDVVLLYDVLHLIDDWALLFQYAYRILKPSGILSVYPMHIDTEKVKRYIGNAGFTSTCEINAILNFSK